MQYVVYCDESRHDGGAGAHFMPIGSLWAPRPRKSQITKSLRALFRQVGLGSEDALRLRSIVIDHARFDPGRFHAGDRKLGFYKFYYEMLDFKHNQSADRYRDLRAVLTRKLRGEAQVLDLTVIDSRETPRAQLCDLLTGAVASTWSADSKTGIARAELCAHIANPLSLSTLKLASPSPAISKFNGFKIDLQ